MKKPLSAYCISAIFITAHSTIEFIDAFYTTDISYTSVVENISDTVEPDIVYIDNIETGAPIEQDMQRTIDLIRLYGGIAKIVHQK